MADATSDLLAIKRESARTGRELLKEIDGQSWTDCARMSATRAFIAKCVQEDEEVIAGIEAGNIRAERLDG